MNKKHPCYLPQNAARLKQLRQLEAKQRRGELKKLGMLELYRLKELLGIGVYK